MAKNEFKKCRTVLVEIDIDAVMGEVGIGDALEAFTIAEIVDELSIETLLDEIGKDDAIEHFGLTIVD